MKPCCSNIMHSVDLNAAVWCSLNKEFENYSIQDICLNSTAFPSQPACLLVADSVYCLQITQPEASSQQTSSCVVKPWWIAPF